MTAVAPILPTEARVHLLTAISALPDDIAAVAWSELGISFMSGMECALPSGWPTCQADANAVKVDGTQSDGAVTFTSFLAYYDVECDGYMHEQSEARKAMYARTTFDAVKHISVAEQLWFANTEAANPSLQSSAALAWASAATAQGDPIYVIARLVAERNKLSGSGTVLIHGPLALVPYLKSSFLIEERNGRYEGPGFVYVTDAGYPDDVSPPGLTAGPLHNFAGAPTTYADAPGECWLYASGRIEYALGRYVGKSMLGAPTDDSGTFSDYTTWSSRTNETFILVEQEAFLRFDPCGILAARTVIPIDSCCGEDEVVTLTQAQYDALAVKDPDTFYVIGS